MPRNKEYWVKRMEALEDMAYMESEEYYKDIQEQFRRATNEIQQDIELWYYRIEDNNNISYAAAKKLLKKNELEEFHWTVEQYIKAGEENAIDQRWMKQLENASAKVHISRLEAMKTQIQQHAEILYSRYEKGITEFLGERYKNGYYRTAFEIMKGTGVGYDLHAIDTRTIDIVLTKPWAADGANFSDRIWKDKKRLVNVLHTELSQHMIRGESVDKMIENVSKAMNVSKKQAGRLIMTETSAISSIATKESYKDLGVEQYEILATLDYKTSEICRQMDKKVFSMSDYAISVTAPPFHPFCRSTTIPYFDDEFTEDEQRAARGVDGKTYYVPADMKFEEWYKTCVDTKAEKVYNNYGMKICFPDLVMKVRGVTPDIKNQLDSAINTLMEEYDIRIGELSVEPAGKGDIFVTGWYDGKMGMVVNENIDFERVIKKMSSKYKSGYMAGKSLEDYIAHEMFHVMLYQDCKTEHIYRAKYMQIESLYGQLKGISGYADSCQSGNEALAEAFVRIRNGETVPALAKAVVEAYIGRWRK